MPNWCFSDCCVYSSKKDEVLKFKKAFIDSYYCQNESLYGRCSWGFLYNKTKGVQLDDRKILSFVKDYIKENFPDVYGPYGYYVKGTISKGDGKKSLLLGITCREIIDKRRDHYKERTIEKEVEYGLFDESDEIVNADSSTYNLILNLLNLKNGDHVEGNCRGEIINFDDDDDDASLAFENGYYGFFFQCETAWNEFDGLHWAIDELKKKGEYTDLNFVCVAEECGNGYYINTDDKHIFFKTEVKVDTDISPFCDIDCWDASKECVFKQLIAAAKDSNLPVEYKNRLKNVGSLDEFGAVMKEYTDEQNDDVLFEICYY